MIPRVIHQIWITSGDGAPAPPPRLEDAMAAWRELGEGWEYRLWDDASLTELFAERRPDLLELYRWYPYAVQKSDAGRYLVLHEFGGIYADVDVAPGANRETLGRIVNENEVVLAPTEPLGVAADLVMSAPRHPLIRRALDALPRSRTIWHRPWVPRHFRCMAGTGPLHLTAALRRYDGPVRLLTKGEYGHGAERESLVRHLPGNTWAGWDTYAFLFVARHAVSLALLAALGIAALVWLVTR